MKKIFLSILIVSSVLWGRSDLNESIGVFKSLMEDVAYLVGVDKNHSKVKKIQNSQTSVTQSEEAEEKKFLKKIGIVIDDGKIEIDANKTKSFFENLNRAFERGIDSGVKKASKEAPTEEDLGIRIEGEKVEIDLNKTKNFMKKWIKAIEVFAKELNSTLKSLEQ